jgi:serine/threonine protein kinase
MPLKVGDTIEVKGKSHKAENVWEKLVAEDGIISETNRYLLKEVLGEGDICQVFKATEMGGYTVVAKVCRHPSDNDLVENEAKILGDLNPASAGDESFYRYLPRVLKTAEHEDSKVNILTYFEGGVSLADILTAYPKGIDFRDAAWMYKRMLVGVGFAHTRKFIHGAVTLPHVLVHPVNHGGKIIDWSYAVKLHETSRTFDRITAVSLDYEAYYPPEVLKKENPTPATDIYMMAKCMVALLGGNVQTNEMPAEVPEAFQAFLQESLHESQHMRPRDAWNLHDELDTLLKDLVGKRVYRAFTMPGAT